jgi:hypothetical protein
VPERLISMWKGGADNVLSAPSSFISVAIPIFQAPFPVPVFSLTLLNAVFGVVQ